MRPGLSLSSLARSVYTQPALSLGWGISVAWYALWLPRWLGGKESACQCRRCRFNSWVKKIPWRRKWQPTPLFFPRKSHGQRSLLGCSPWGCIVGHDLVTTYMVLPSRWAAIKAELRQFFLRLSYIQYSLSTKDVNSLYDTMCPIPLTNIANVRARGLFSGLKTIFQPILALRLASLSSEQPLQLFLAAVYIGTCC